MKKLARDFTLTINGEKRTVKMTVGMLHELSALVGHIELIAETLYSPDLRHDLLVEMLSKRDEEGIISEKLNIRTLDADPEEIIGLLKWATEHVADFLLKAVTTTKDVLDRHKKTLDGLMPSNSGGAA